ncbi:hypothetical protein [Streptomyces tsukubensis]|uniref:hypothetical protein n=1 Tax=Streptomyces tsukubensis TaxID=83656 RepID=UPI001D055B22|nr:hypothetical protein [Streptomyces tsukubensis]
MLTASEKELISIKGEFDGIGDWKKEVQSALGAGRMVGAMGTFVDNWDRHRKELVGEIEQVGGFVSSCRKGFEKVDRDLAESARKARRDKKKEK